MDHYVLNRYKYAARALVYIVAFAVAGSLQYEIATGWVPPPDRYFEFMIGSRFRWTTPDIRYPRLPRYLDEAKSSRFSNIISSNVLSVCVESP